MEGGHLRIGEEEEEEVGMRRIFESVALLYQTELWWQAVAVGLVVVICRQGTMALLTGVLVVVETLASTGVRVKREPVRKDLLACAHQQVEVEVRQQEGWELLRVYPGDWVMVVKVNSGVVVMGVEVFKSVTYMRIVLIESSNL